MNNFFKKIGVGAISLSLVLGVAASNGLVANANSNVNGKSIDESNANKERLAKIRQSLLNIKIGSKLNELGSWGNVALAKEAFGFKVLGAYSSSDKNGSLSEYNRILDDVNELNESKKFKNIENIENNVKGFKDGKQFFEYIFGHGMEKGIHKVSIGNDFLILLLEESVEVKNKGINNINEDIDNIKKIISQKESKLKNANIKEIEGKDYLDIFIGENNDNQSKK